MSASVPFKDVRKMLKNCADGYTMRDTDHNRRIEYDGIIYPSFPARSTRVLRWVT